MYSHYDSPAKKLSIHFLVNLILGVCVCAGVRCVKFKIRFYDMARQQEGVQLA